MGLKAGESAGRLVSQRIFAATASGLLLAAAAGSLDLDDGMIAFCADGSRWRYVAASTATDASNNLVLSPSDSPTAGRWLRDDDVIDVKLAATFATADAAALFTVPVGFILRVTRAFWFNDIAWTGGASSAIGLSSSNAAYSTKGDLEGGAAGDLTAAMGTGYKGAVGAKLASSGLVVLVAGDTIRFDRIASIYTAGSGTAHVFVEPLS